eukprot:4208650-Pyramimonas_sp.AAC.1
MVGSEGTAAGQVHGRNRWTASSLSHFPLVASAVRPKTAGAGLGFQPIAGDLGIDVLIAQALAGLRVWASVSLRA